jgi:hypothetical protein
MSCLIVGGGPSGEWRAVLVAVGWAIVGLGLVDFETKDDGGKCLFLYIRSTR